MYIGTCPLILKKKCLLRPEALPYLREAHIVSFSRSEEAQNIRRVNKNDGIAKFYSLNFVKDCRIYHDVFSAVLGDELFDELLGFGKDNAFLLFDKGRGRKNQSSKFPSVHGAVAVFYVYAFLGCDFTEGGKNLFPCIFNCAVD